MLPEHRKHLDELTRSIRENDGFTPLEADEGLNLSARVLITACMREWGGVFVGIFNEYGKDKASDPSAVLRRLDPREPICAFSCDFAVPTEDHELIRLVLAYRAAPSMASIEAVNGRVKAVGGVLVNWS